LTEVNVDRGFGRMREMLAETTGLDPVTIKAFPAFGMLLRPGLFDHVTIGTAR
jgi:hypothetical protein